MTPHRFAAKYVTIPIDDYVCLVHDPRKTSPAGRMFTVKHLGNVVGGEIVKYLNIDVALMKRIAMQALSDGEPVWFGCDVGKQMDRAIGLWDAALLDYDRLYDTTFAMDKAYAPGIRGRLHDPRDAVHRRGRQGRQAAAVAGREQLG